MSISTKTPNNIFQTHKSINYIKSKSKIINAVQSWKKQPNFCYYFYSDALCENFIKKHFNGKVYQAYMKLPLAVMKADLWRYCVIYHFGGIYADTDAVLLHDPNIFLNNALLTVAPENEVHFCNWTFSAPKKSPIIRNIINLSVKRILAIHEIKGEHIVHDLTGPGVFTDGIEEYLNKNGHQTHQNKKHYSRYRNNTIMVFNHTNFHNNIIKHLFSGQDQDGWSNERYKKLL